MASLRTRLLVSVLRPLGRGAVALAAVTYAEQRSFLLGRVDSSCAKPGRRCRSRSTTRASARRAKSARRAGAARRAQGGPARRRPPAAARAPTCRPAPTASAGTRRGKVLGHVLISYGQAAPAGAVAARRACRSTGSSRSARSDPRACTTGRSCHRDPRTRALTIVAVPLQRSPADAAPAAARGGRS